MKTRISQRALVDQLIGAVVAAEVQRTEDRTRSRIDQRVRVRTAGEDQASSEPWLISWSAPSSPRKSSPPRMEPVDVLINVSASEPPVNTRLVSEPWLIS